MTRFLTIAAAAAFLAGAGTAGFAQTATGQGSAGVNAQTSGGNVQGGANVNSGATVNSGGTGAAVNSGAKVGAGATTGATDGVASGTMGAGTQNPPKSTR